MKQRVISAVVLLTIALTCIFVSFVTRVLFFGVVGILCAYEYSRGLEKINVYCAAWVMYVYIAVQAVLALTHAGAVSYIACFTGGIYLAMFSGIVHRKVSGQGAIYTVAGLAYPGVIYGVMMMISVGSIWDDSLILGARRVHLGRFSDPRRNLLLGLRQLRAVRRAALRKTQACTECQSKQVDRRKRVRRAGFDGRRACDLGTADPAASVPAGVPGDGTGFLFRRTDRRSRRIDDQADAGPQGLQQPDPRPRRDVRPDGQPDVCHPDGLPVPAHRRGRRVILFTAFVL